MSVTEVAPYELNAAATAAAMEEDIKRRVSHLIQEADLRPSLVILSDNYLEGTPTKQYIDLKTRVGGRLGMTVFSETVDPATHIPHRIETYNESALFQGTIVQLPLLGLAGLDEADRVTRTSTIVSTIAPEKDVDGLGTGSLFEPATAVSILKLLEANDIDLSRENVVIRGRGTLVGSPLSRILQRHGILHYVLDAETPEDERRQALNEASVIISATGQPHGLRPSSFDTEEPKIVVDAGTAEQKGDVVGDVSDELRAWGAERGWRFTPKKGGVGKLTVRTLLLHVVEASEKLVEQPDYTAPQHTAPRKFWPLPKDSLQGLKPLYSVEAVPPRA